VTDVEDNALDWPDDAVIAAAFVDVGPYLHQSRWAVDVDYWGYRLQSDHTFAIEMGLCKEWGIPHSTFLEWGDVDRAKAIAHHLHEARRCTCGIHPDEWDPTEYPPPFVVEFHTCPGCEAMDSARRHLQERAKSGSGSVNDGVKPYLRRVR
jgi:hypothetical protein